MHWFHSGAGRWSALIPNGSSRVMNCGDGVPDYCLSESEEENQGEPKPKRGRGRKRLWVLCNKFYNLKEAEDFVNSENTWSPKFTQKTEERQKRFYGCNKVPKKGPQCAAELYLLFECGTKTVFVYRADADHNHNDFGARDDYATWMNLAGGKSLIRYKSYVYYSHCKLKRGDRWRCNQYFQTGCLAFVVVDESLRVMKAADIHHHPPPMYLLLLVKGRNGKDLLMLEGYTYYQHKILRDGFRWSCTQMGSRSCRGFLHVTNDMFVVRAFTQHTHPPSTFSWKSTKNQKRTNDNKRHNLGKDALNPLALKIASIKGRAGF
ncbi:hypothetical protein PYW08_016050 [Mythimna loreyi]|uniref:Uncharacterized protein n=1 Tax=Mythimna loreyi TaxID=667449 RepID=A0ACC2QTI1_9NEOP|nr:hypothetical protein PYW08_016050 [Mythimna loreyi]